MDDLEGYFRAVDRLNRAKRRAQFRQEIADGLRGHRHVNGIGEGARLNEGHANCS
jgi:hypothetical protein